MSRSKAKPTKPASKKSKPRPGRRSAAYEPASDASPQDPNPGKPAKRSGLDAAAQVLREAGEPITTPELVKRMLEGGLWTTNGKTPAATLYCAMIREITAKGSTSRFRKSGPGLFAAAT